ncbi:hypothetical protein [Paracoccus marcusii]|uniref:hypothetical protein n=1 Tax=Paracoccus marcusii TaxID=59779 RepID=UPI0024927A6E|nr:hypothetical protein [Paracoccus marcusii]
MEDFNELLEQQEQIKKKIADASTSEVADIKKRLDVISNATGKTISQLLGLTKTTQTKKNKSDTDKDQKYRDWLESSKGTTHTINGKPKLIGEGTRLTDNIRKYVDSLDLA